MVAGLPICRVAWLGLVEYDRALSLQQQVVEWVKAGQASNTLLLLEHPHVYTLGRRAKDSDLLADEPTLRALGATVRRVDRGGEATYHGPGQLVGYPILDLRAWGGGPVRYVRALEATLLRTLADFGIEACTDPRRVGVWVRGAKVAAIGVRITGGVTYHGFALNVNTDLAFFRHIVPCGMPGCEVTSMARLAGRSIDAPAVRERLVARFGEALGFAMVDGEAGTFASVADSSSLTAALAAHTILPDPHT